MSSPSWDDYRTFLAVLETGSLSAAGRRLGLSHPTIRARIEGLERSLGTILFTRSVNGLLPTEGAESMREAATSMAHAFDHWEGWLRRRQMKLAGVLGSAYQR